MERATLDRIQQLIDEETAERFPADVVPRLALARHGDEPVIEPGELYLRVSVGQDFAARQAWMEEHADQLWDFQAERLPEVKGILVTADAPDAARRGPTGTLKLTGISMLDPEQNEIARGLTPVVAHLGPADLETLDTLITAGIAASRSECTRWALARVREQPAYAELSAQAQNPSGLTGLDRAVRGRLQAELDALVKGYFPDGEVQRVALLQYGDDPWVELGDQLVRVFIGGSGEDPALMEWERDHEATFRALHRELAAKVPAARYLEFWFGGDTSRECLSRQRLRCPPDNPARRERDLTVVDVRLGPADREMLDTLITAGLAASRAEAISWTLARIRERPAYARLSERVRELAPELKGRF